MTLSTVAVLRPGDWVHYDGSEHQVLALAGTSVRLRTVDGADSVVLAGVVGIESNRQFGRPPAVGQAGGDAGRSHR
jgi:hypothetical protein